MGEHKLNPVAAAHQTPRPSCGSCPHYMKETASQGHCRHGPPTCFMVMLKGTLPGPASYWPPVRAEQWCGQHPDFMRWWMSAQRRMEEQQLAQVPIEGAA